MKVKVFAFLQVTVWDIIGNVFKKIGKPIPDPTANDLEQLLDDDVWKLYEDGITATLNQTGTDSGTPQVMKYKPRSVAELSAWVAAIRPSFASMKETFLNRKDFSYGIPEFDKLLEDSNNFILYQESIMKVLVYAGFPEDETYGLLKAISKKKEGVIEPIYDKFIDGFAEKTGSREKAEKVWEIIEDAVGYGFNSSHALSVAYDSLYGAYLKAKYPLDYYSYVLNIYEGNTDMTNRIYQELEYFGITVNHVKFGEAQSEYSKIEDQNVITKGLKSIKYMNNQTATELMKVYENNHDNIVDIFIDIEENAKVDKRQTKILISLGFFRDFGGNKYLLDLFDYFSSRYKKTHVDKTKEKRRQEVLDYIKELDSSEILGVREQLFSEIDYLGYIQTKYPNAEKRDCIILDIDKRRVPKIYLHTLRTGKEIMMKMDKKIFYDKKENGRLKAGDTINITNVKKKGKWQLQDGKWIQSKTDKEPYIMSCRIIKSEDSRKDSLQVN